MRKFDRLVDYLCVYLGGGLMFYSVYLYLFEEPDFMFFLIGILLNHSGRIGLIEDPFKEPTDDN